MTRLGIWLIVLGVLPRLGFDLPWFEYLGRARVPVAAGLIVIGAALGSGERPAGRHSGSPLSTQPPQSRTGWPSARSVILACHSASAWPSFSFQSLA